MKKLTTLVMGFLLVHMGHGQSVEDNIVAGNNYYKQGQFELAEKAYRQALKADPANAVAQRNLGNALHQQKKAKEAIEAFSNVSATAENKNMRSAAFYNTGVVYSRQKDLESSIEAYKNALRLDPNDKEARENLQKALLELKQKQQQQQNNQQQKKPQSSSMSQKEAEKKLDQLEEKEKKIQQRIQNQKGGIPQPNDW